MSQQPRSPQKHRSFATRRLRRFTRLQLGWILLGAGVLLLLLRPWARPVSEGLMGRAVPGDGVSLAASSVAPATSVDARGDAADLRADIEVRLDSLRLDVPAKPQATLPRLRNLLAEVESSSGAESLEAAAVLDVLVECLWRTGAAGDAETGALAAWALRVKRQLLPDDDPRIAASLRNQGILAELNDHLDAARDLYLQARQLLERAHGPADPGVAMLTNDLAIVATRRGQYGEAIREYDAALEILEGAPAPDELEIAVVLNGLGIAHYEVGDYVEARRMHERALELRRRHLPPEHPKVAETLNNLGALLIRMGDEARARELFEQVLAVRRQVYGESHPLTAAAMVNLARVLLNEERRAEAHELYESALHILQGAPAQGTMISCLLGLGILHRQMGQLEEAREFFTQALKIERETLGPEHPFVGQTLHRMAGVELEAGDLDQAQRLCTKALALRERGLGSEHPAVAESQVLLAEILAAQGRHAQAFELASRAEALSRQNVEAASRSMAQREALLFARMRARGLDLMQQLAVDDSIDAGERASVTWDAVTAARALVLDEMVQRSRTAATAGDPELGRLVAQYQAANERFANLAFRSFDGGAAQRDVRLHAAALAKEAAERQLAAKSQEFRDWQARRLLGLDEITRSLPPDGVLLSYSIYRRRGANRFGTPVRELVAYVAAPDAPVRLVPLGPMHRVDSLVAAWSFEAAVGIGVRDRSERESELAYRRAGEALRRAVWDPLSRFVESAQYVFVVPDGSLHWVDLAALPRGAAERPDDGYLADDDRRWHVLSAERDLVPHRTARTGRGLLALGGADFDRVVIGSKAPTVAGAPAVARGEPSGSEGIELALARRGGIGPCDDLSALHFDPLPETRQEVEDVAALWGDRRTVRLLTGAAASDLAFKAMAPGKRILHLATHGFFLDGSCTPVEGTPVSMDTAARRGIQLRHRPVETAERPAPALVLRAGLALAGANVRDATLAGSEDGILTAEEIAALDLQGVEWAVLSACNTGLGEVQIGEGVLGLRRAFQVAGVGSVIMSLWPVADQPTREWMRALYVAHLQRGLGTADAVHAAHRTTLAARRARGASTHPFYWAGFVSTGDWR